MQMFASTLALTLLGSSNGFSFGSQRTSFGASSIGKPWSTKTVGKEDTTITRRSFDRSSVIQSCYACGRNAMYSLYDGGVVAQAPIAIEKFRKDYELSPYRINRLSLNFNLNEDETLVSSTMNVTPQSKAAALGGVAFELDGDDIKLQSIELNGQALKEHDDYVLTKDGLSILDPPNEAGVSFTLKTIVSIEPQKNTQLSGLYKSNGMYVTQCEAQGFRRITYFQDRPDVMATYDVRVEANKEKYPVLLSNGNAVEKGDLENGRHWASFNDPFPKPSYLFAVVAGDLGHIEGEFKTMSGRDVQLMIWSEHDNVDQLDWAMQSLKDSMSWDEKTYGREYDLDVYNIVAVNDFNMGAMENKGLNIFNTAAVLAKPSTATDTDYERVQGVVGHEYFHNWSGNRVTCRDWFQLTLKEGLTVFRDQHFSQDMTSEAVKRIEDVNVVRSSQFVQDAGPMAHPIRPESYIAMDNFYTVTVYNKGAEVIRMYRTILGRETFREAMDLYFERHDGQAVTCDDFRKAMADASGRDLTQFEKWYLQAGTPTVTATSKYDSESKTYSLTLSQSTDATPGQPNKDTFHIPVEVGLLGKDGTVLTERTLELTEETKTFEFKDLSEEPYVSSLFRGFSAPVNLKYDITPDQLAFLAANDNDPFNRWDASQQLYTRSLLQLAKTWRENKDSDNENKKELKLDDSVANAFRSTLLDKTLDPSLVAYSMSLPGYSMLAQKMSPIDADAILAASKFVRKSLAQQFKEELVTTYNSLDANGEPYAIDEKQVGKRRLRNTCLSYLSSLEQKDTIELCIEQFRSAEIMTDSLASLQALSSTLCPERDEALNTFYTRAKENKEALVINKWLQVQARADVPNAVDKVRALTKHEAYESTNPNAIRALIQVFASGNPAGFHNIDGSGYAFIADEVIEIDRTNPQVAARLASSFDTWRKHTNERKALMQTQLERIQENATSPDTREIVSRSLA